MNLFVISSHNNIISIQEVPVSKETSKILFLDCPELNRQKILKDSVNTYLKSGQLFAYSPEDALKLWNQYHTNKAKELREEALIAESLITKHSASQLLITK